VDGSRQKSTRRWLPYALGAVLVAQFVGLGLWQISRAQEKRATLLDNIIVDGRNGHYVLTSLVYSPGEPALIVNRGWVAGSGDGVDPAALALPDSRVTVRGRAGALPRPGYRMGAAIESATDWPRHAVYPTLDELAAALRRELQPFVLLLSPDEDYGLLRRWEPAEIGPGRHYAYAFQWFAMAVVLAGLLAWNFRKRGYRT
jgi:surfeit locus 1 family protein